MFFAMENMGCFEMKKQNVSTTIHTQKMHAPAIQHAFVYIYIYISPNI